jgi:hypothetical protein
MRELIVAEQRYPAVLAVLAEGHPVPAAAERLRWWGGWGSNPRPRDYECLRYVRCADQYRCTLLRSIGRRILGCKTESLPSTG